MRRLEVDGWWARGRRTPSLDYGNRGAALVVRLFGRWVRLGVAVGSPPGSHIGFWRSRMGSGMAGWNLRVGKRYIGPCVTAWVHTRPLEDGR